MPFWGKNGAENAWLQRFLTYLVHELDTKNYAFQLHSGNKKHGFLVSSGFLFSRKVWWGFRLGTFYPKFRYFEDQNVQNWGLYEINFDYIQIQKWMSQTVRAKKLDGKSRQFV